MKRYHKPSKPLSSKKQALALSRQLAAVKAQHSAACQQVITLGFEKQTAAEKVDALEKENGHLRQVNDSILQPVLARFRHVSFDNDPDKTVKFWRLTGQFALGINVDAGNVLMQQKHPEAAAAYIESLASHFARQVYQAAKKSLIMLIP